jgi:hypothetical protein
MFHFKVENREVIKSMFFSCKVKDLRVIGREIIEISH